LPIDPGRVATGSSPADWVGVGVEADELAVRVPVGVGGEGGWTAGRSGVVGLVVGRLQAASMRAAPALAAARTRVTGVSVQPQSSATVHHVHLLDVHPG